MDATLDLHYQLLRRTLADLGATGPLVRTVLIRDRHLVGYRFRCGALQAVRLFGGNEIEFYDEAGTLLKTVSVEASEENRAA